MRLVKHIIINLIKMNTGTFAYLYTFAIALFNAGAGKVTVFSPFTGGFMYYWGLVASYLFYGGLNGIPSLLLSPFWVIYSMIIAVPASASWAAY
jgi:hypothetical protein